MTRPLVLFLFNSSPYAVQPWLDDGRFDCISMDYSSTDHSTGPRLEWLHPRHLRVNRDLSTNNPFVGIGTPSLVISFPPCTDLAVSGAKHFKSKLEANPMCQLEAVRMAQLAESFGCPYMVENPVSVLSTLWRKPAVYWHPWEYSDYIPKDNWRHPEFPGLLPDGDRYYKKTGLWCGNGFIVPTPKNSGPPENSNNPGWEKLGGKSGRTKYIRSLTPRGFSQAVYEANHKGILADGR